MAKKSGLKQTTIKGRNTLKFKNVKHEKIEISDRVFEKLLNESLKRNDELMKSLAKK